MNILFLCVANSARSQMAEGLARSMAGSEFEFFSAGSYPSRVHPLAVRVMKELAIDISEHRSKSVDSLDLGQMDWVITLCDETICPSVPSRVHQAHWPITDPAMFAMLEEQQLQGFRNTRDLIRKKLEVFLAERTREKVG